MGRNRIYKEIDGEIVDESTDFWNYGVEWFNRANNGKFGTFDAMYYVDGKTGEILSVKTTGQMTRERAAQVERSSRELDNRMRRNNYK